MFYGKLWASGATVPAWPLQGQPLGNTYDLGHELLRLPYLGQALTCKRYEET